MLKMELNHSSLGWTWILLSVLLVGPSDGDRCGGYDVRMVEDCRRPMMDAISRISSQHHKETEDRINVTCQGWYDTKVCFEGLMMGCTQDPKTHDRYNRTLDGMKIYSAPCWEENPQRRERLIECYMPHLPRIDQCQVKMDSLYYDAVLDEKYDKACQSLSDLIDCYADIQSRIRAECSQPGVDEFDKNNLDPLVEETKPFVVANCRQMAPQHTLLYGISSDTNSGCTKTLCNPQFLILLLLFLYVKHSHCVAERHII